MGVSSFALSSENLLLELSQFTNFALSDGDNKHHLKIYDTFFKHIFPLSPSDLFNRLFRLCAGQM